MKGKKPKVVVGLSGGVDSSAGLILLKRQGYQPIGVSLKYAVWQSKKNILKENICCSKKSFAIAQKICEQLKVPYHIVNQEIDFKEKVIGYYLSLLKNKETPNPCLICNRLVKFNKLLEFAEKKGAQYVATGHYAKIRKNQQGDYQLLRPKDKKKDQTYFLCLLEQKQMAKIIFPLADYTKDQVYQIVKKQGFDFFEKTRQSQDLCFVAGKSIPFFLEEKIGFEPGQIIDKKSNVLGRHQGLHFYTIGQRKGINLANGPWWVAGFCKKKNQLIVTNQENDPLLFKKEAFLNNPHFISSQALTEPVRVKAKTRFNQDLAWAKIYPKESKLVFEKPQKAVCPGQWAVFYKGRICLGGAKIIG